MNPRAAIYEMLAIKRLLIAKEIFTLDEFRDEQINSSTIIDSIMDTPPTLVGVDPTIYIKKMNKRIEDYLRTGDVK